MAPIIHEWTYEAMVFDLVGDTPALKENVFTFDAETQGGKDTCSAGRLVLPW